MKSKTVLHRLLRSVKPETREAIKKRLRALPPHERDRFRAAVNRAAKEAL